VIESSIWIWTEIESDRGCGCGYGYDCPSGFGSCHGRRSLLQILLRRQLALE
jgi:hypothetical protein